MKKRTITLLSHPDPIAIDPSDYRRACDGASAKDFDKNSTRTLRVWREVNGGPHLVHATRSESGQIVAEAYDIAPMVQMLPGVVERVAKHVGVEDLVKQVALP